jgi:hypothetical protein
VRDGLDCWIRPGAVELRCQCNGMGDGLGKSRMGSSVRLRPGPVKRNG